MKVCLVNTYEITGGAAVSCNRLFHALNGHDDIKAKMLVGMGSAGKENIIPIDQTFWGKWKGKVNLIKERLRFKPYHNGEINEFYFSPALDGMDISNHPAILEADIINLHWTNLGFLSLSGIQKLAALGKPIVWSLHDMWTFTGGCHYTGECDHFTRGCGDCMFLKRPGPDDISHRLNMKKSFFREFQFSTSTKWLQHEALRSSILKSANVVSIHMPIDLNVFQPKNRKSARERLGLDTDKSYILFGAANVDDKRKGFDYLVRALDLLAPDIGENKPEILLFGKNIQQDSKVPFKVNSLGSVSNMDTISTIYSAADLFVIPSMQDNLPCTVMESHACGTPVVGFDTAGVTEMIDHKVNGYLARFKDADDLAQGIRYILGHEGMREACRTKAVENYTPADVAEKYYRLFNSLL